MKIFDLNIKDNLIIFGLPILGYVLTYAFQLGLFAGYRIDNAFIQPDPQIIIAVTLLCAFTLLAITFSRYYLRAVFKIPRYIDNLKGTRKGWILLSFTSIYVLAIYLIIKFDLWHKLSIPLQSLVLIVIIIGSVLLLEYDISGILIKSHLMHEQDEVTKKRNRGIVKLTVTVAAAIASSYMFGLRIATPHLFNAMPHSYTKVGKKSMVVIVKYGDEVYVKEYDAGSKKLANNFQILEITDRTFYSARMDIQN